jgi:RNA methyltransferase, TrmH family
MELTISSTQNPTFKHVQKMSKPRYRRESGEMLVEGYREILRAMDNRHPVKQLLICPEFFLGANEAAMIDRVLKQGGRIVRFDRELFQRMSYRDRPDGLLALCPHISLGLDDVKLPANPLLLVAVAIEKPGNLGTMIRSADAAGVDAVLVCDRNTDIHNPNVVRASVGTLFSLPVVECEGSAARAWLHEKGITPVATTPSATLLHFQADLSGPLALILGSEQFGLDQDWLSSIQTHVRIPMEGQCDSLNVSSAGSLVLYEALRQRKYMNPCGERTQGT